MTSPIKCVVFDLDGTIYFGNRPAQAAAEMIDFCKNKYKNIFFASNNSFQTRDEVYKKLKNMGLNVTPDEVLSATYLTGEYLLKNNITNVYSMGSKAFNDYIFSLGIKEDKENPQAVVIGYNPDFKLSDMVIPLNIYLKTKCRVIAANPDRKRPLEDGVYTPGGGSIVKAFEYAANKEADVLISKPSTTILDIVAAKTGAKPDEILVIGDIYEIDVKMAQDYGARYIYIQNEGGNFCSNCNTVKSLKEALEVLKNEN